MRWQTPPSFTGEAGADVQAVSRQHGLEGIVAKRLASRYEPGKRTGSWLKIKNIRRQEVVVGGWKPGEGKRAGLFGSLLIGVQGPDGLEYAGHVGTGFSQQALEMLWQRLTPLRRATSPFAGEVPPEHARRAVWVRAGAGDRGGLHRVDLGRAHAGTLLPGAAHGQGTGRGRPRALTMRAPGDTTHIP